jgi:hypothetical protein
MYIKRNDSISFRFTEMCPMQLSIRSKPRIAPCEYQIQQVKQTFLSSTKSHSPVHVLD